MTKHSEDFKAINQALDLLEVERLNLGFWKMYAQLLLMRADKDYARQSGLKLLEATKEAAKDRELINKAHIQDALIDFESELKRLLE